MERSKTFPQAGHDQLEFGTNQSTRTTPSVDDDASKKAPSSNPQMKRSITPRGQIFSSLDDALRNITHRNPTPANVGTTNLSPEAPKTPKTPDQNSSGHHDDDSNKS